MTKSVKIVFIASALGVTTGIEVNGKLISNRTIVPPSNGARDGYIKLKPGNLVDDIRNHPGLYSLAELLEFRMGSLNTELLDWFLDGGENV